MDALNKKCRFTIFPFFAIFILPSLLTMLLYHSSANKTIDFSQSGSILKIILGFAVYAFVLVFPYSKKLITNGPVQVDMSVPEYNRNGFFYYILTMGIQSVYTYLYGSSVFIYLLDNQILSSILLTVTGCIFTVYLFLAGKQRHLNLKKNDQLHHNLQEPVGSNWLYQYYRGMDFHAKIFGVDVKQLTNCRFGMMIWQVLVLGFGTASIERNGMDYGVVATTVLQTLYIAKFFYWEMGYFYTLDMVLDRAGFYICWGCIVFVPCFYTLPSFAIASNQPQMSGLVATIYTVLGISFLIFNYWVDQQKQYFQKCIRSGQKCMIWGKEAEFMNVEYEKEGKIVKSKLLLAGFWGMSRHMNYTFELLLAFSWCNVGGWGASNAYFYFLTLLLISRLYRDEDKCSKKYGKFWKQYCEKVPYRMIPYVY